MITVKECQHGFIRMAYDFEDELHTMAMEFNDLRWHKNGRCNTSSLFPLTIANQRIGAMTHCCHHLKKASSATIGQKV
jgi:hypothetical protein